MAWVFLVLAALVALAALRVVLPRPPSRLQLWWMRCWGAVVDRVRGRREPVPDPFDALRLQTRLGVLADEIRDLETAPRVFAKAHRLTAARAAYDDLLDEACRLADVPVTQEEARGEALRWYEEQELSARGWSW